MKRFARWTTPLALVALFACGCNEMTEPGGPGAPVGEGEADDNTFRLSLPSVSIAPGEGEEATIRLNAGSEFDQPVTVTLTPPQGIVVEPQEFELTKDQTERNVMIKVDPTATAGDQMINVVGKPATGAQTDGQIAVTVGEAAAEPAAETPDDATDAPPSDLTPPAEPLPEDRPPSDEGAAELPQ